MLLLEIHDKIFNFKIHRVHLKNLKLFFNVQYNLVTSEIELIYLFNLN